MNYQELTEQVHGFCISDGEVYYNFQNSNDLGLIDEYELEVGFGFKVIERDGLKLAVFSDPRKALFQEGESDPQALEQIFAELKECYSTKGENK